VPCDETLFIYLSVFFPACFSQMSGRRRSSNENVLSLEPGAVFLNFLRKILHPQNLENTKFSTRVLRTYLQIRQNLVQPRFSQNTSVDVIWATQHAVFNVFFIKKTSFVCYFTALSRGRHQTFECSFGAA